MFYATPTEFGLTAQQVRNLLPHVTFTPGADLTEHGFFVYVPSTPPNADETTVSEKYPEVTNGVLTQAWESTPWTQEQKDTALAAAKIVKNAQINQKRLEVNRSSFPYEGKDIACDELSRSDIDAVASHIALFGAYPSGFPGAWKATDNTYVSIPTIEDFKAMFSAMTAQGNANFALSQQLKADLANATTVAQVNAIVW